MNASPSGIIKIRRSWLEEGISALLTAIGAVFVIFVLDRPQIAPLYLVWFLVFFHMNRRLGIDMTPIGAVARTMFWRSRPLPRAEITDVVINKQGPTRWVELRVREGKPVKLPIKNAFGSKGEKRLLETHALIRQWWFDTAPAATLPVPVGQTPGSASI
jgi:hypothetical protein